jgi:formylglycine-generating enzyme required for sulfatase activity
MIRTSLLLFITILLISCQSDYKLDKINPDLLIQQKQVNNTTNMVLVESGNAIIGDDDWFEKGHKKKIVNIPSFYIDKYEVSNRDYNTCFNAKVCRKPEYYGMKEVNSPMQPVVGVSFDDAATFCKWMNKRLPTEDEWEKAARGPNGNIYPWGNEKLDCNKAVYGLSWSKDCLKSKSLNLKLKYTKNVESLPNSKSYYGLYNMSGNVWEWVDTEYIPHYFNKPKEADVTYKTIKGGSFGSSHKYLVTYSRRWERNYQRTIGTGFRCAKDIEQ